MILKIQKPLAGDLTQLLIYSKDRRVFELLPYMPAKVWDRWFGEKEKKFVEGQLDGRTLTIENEVPDEDW